MGRLGYYIRSDATDRSPRDGLFTLEQAEDIFKRYILGPLCAGKDGAVLLLPPSTQGSDGASYIQRTNRKAAEEYVLLSKEGGSTTKEAGCASEGLS